MIQFPLLYSDIAGPSAEDLSMLMEAMSHDAIEELVSSAFSDVDLDKDGRCVDVYFKQVYVCMHMCV